MGKKLYLKIVSAGISGSMALLPFLGVKPYFNGFDDFSGMMVLPVILGLISSAMSYVFLRFRPHTKKLLYYPGVTLTSLVLFSFVFSLIMNLGGHHKLSIAEFGAGMFLVVFGTFAFWPYVLIALGSFISSDLLIEKFVK